MGCTVSVCSSVVCPLYISVHRLWKDVLVYLHGRLETMVYTKSFQTTRIVCRTQENRSRYFFFYNYRLLCYGKWLMNKKKKDYQQHNFQRSCFRLCKLLVQNKIDELKKPNHQLQFIRPNLNCLPWYFSKKVSLLHRVSNH